MLQHLLIKLPSRERPEQLLQVLNAYDRCIAVPWCCEILISIDADDRSMDGFKDRIGHLKAPVRIAVGTRTTKVGAVNRDIELARPWDVLLLASDDMMPVTAGLDSIIRQRMHAFRPNGDACLWFSDGRQARVCTYPIMGRAWYDRRGHIYHPGYRSYYADDEQTEVAMLAGRMYCDPRTLLRHDHTCWTGGIPNDPLYDHNRRDKSSDRSFYTQRASAGFP